MKRVMWVGLLLAPLLGGCSNMWAGVALGGSEGFAGPGAAAVSVEHIDPKNCPNIKSHGSLPATAVTLTCIINADGSKTESATLGQLDSNAIMAGAFKAQADLGLAGINAAQQAAPAIAGAAATAAAGPAAGAAASAMAKALVTPKPLPSTTVSGQGVQVQP